MEKEGYAIFIKNENNSVKLTFDNWYAAQQFIETVLANSDNAIEIIQLYEIEETIEEKYIYD